MSAGEVEGQRGSRILGGADARYAAIATLSTVVVLGVLATAVVTSAGWPTVKEKFFNGAEFRFWFSDVAHAFVTNIQLFLIAEVLILIWALTIAVIRNLPGPVFFPLRAMAVIYTDVFRGIPTILVVYLLGFGVPALGLSGVPTSERFWGTVALVLVYSAYVAEVYRAGIDSVHPSQEAAARSLGLSRWQSLRHVILPQAVRRVVPPLLNDFIGLQKDTALLSVIGVVEVFRQAELGTSADFNYTPLVIAAVLFIAITIPQARFTDWLIARDRRKQLAGRAGG
jgi:polar amino acid transport system permease protein